jgi:hypothetical protein
MGPNMQSGTYNRAVRQKELAAKTCRMKEEIQFIYEHE